MMENFIFDNVGSFYNGNAIVEIQGKWGIINKLGEWVVKPIYDEINTDSSELYPVRIGEEYGAIDDLGNIVIELGKFSCIYNFYQTDKNEVFGVISDGIYLGLIDSKGNIIIPYEYGYEDIMWVDNDTIITKKDDKWGVIDKNNDVIIPFEYDYIDFLKDGYRYVKKADKYGFIDKNGKILELKL